MLYILTFLQHSDFQHYINLKPLSAFTRHLITKHHLLSTYTSLLIQQVAKPVDDGISLITRAKGATLHFSNSRRSRILLAIFYIAIIIMITDHRCCIECTVLWLHLQSEQPMHNEPKTRSAAFCCRCWGKS